MSPELKIKIDVNSVAVGEYYEALGFLSEDELRDSLRQAFLEGRIGRDEYSAFVSGEQKPKRVLNAIGRGVSNTVKQISKIIQR